MRLICPNCDAQYEVPEDVMPREGRDVQCSNCGQTWFQDHPDTIAARESIPPQEQYEDEEFVQAEPPAPEPEPEEPEAQEELSVHEHDPVANVPNIEPEPKPEPAPVPGRRELDPAVADVLREEAEFETKARRNESAAMESQPDLGLSDSDDRSETRKRAEQAKARMARMRGERPLEDTGREAASLSGAALGSRRDLLPDIEEINSTLRSNSDRSPGSDPGQTAQIEMQEKRSSRRGFILTIALVAILALLYTYAPQLAEAVPQAEPALASYVAMVDSWRVWLDGQVSALLTWLDAAAVSSSQ